MKASVVVALVAAGAIAGGGFATYQLAQPSGEVGVQFVNPASQVQPTTDPTATPAVTATSAPVVSSSTTRKAAVRTKEGTVSSDIQPSESSTTPPAPDDPIRNTAPPPVIGNANGGEPFDAQGTGN
jgi:hypothetical protein